MTAPLTEWWAEERKARPASDLGWPAYPWDCRGTSCPCPWSFVVGAHYKHEGFDWPKTRDSVAKALKRKR